MRYLTGLLCVGVLCGLLFEWPQPTFAYHSYTLTVQQLRAGLLKAPSTGAKGFLLVDVRSPEEHASGMIPLCDLICAKGTKNGGGTGYQAQQHLLP